MKAIICFFSGTGNTKKVVDEYKKYLDSKSIETTLVNIDGLPELNLDGVDYVGFAYPIHAFNAPSIVLSFAKQIKKQEKKINYFILKTSGEPLAINNISSCKLKSILKKRNFVLTNEYHYVMPYNMIFRHTDNMAYKMWEAAKQVIPIDCEEILARKPAKLSYIPFGRFMAWILRIEHWYGKINGKKYKVSEDCIKCKACVLKCPVKNISIDEDGNFHFGKNCLMCMRCSFHCPKNAINIALFEGWKVNGAYSFKQPEKEEVDKHKRYCKNSYKKYFARCQRKIENNKK